MIFYKFLKLIYTVNNLKKIGIILLFIFIFYSGFSQIINPNGFNELLYSNGVKSSEGIMKNGKPEGYWKTYYQTGKIKSEGNRKNHKLDSLWKFYSETGILTNQIYYKNGKKNGVTTTYYKEGFKKSEEFWIDNKREKRSIYYDKEENVTSLIPFIENKKQGKGINYAKDGRIITIITYDEGYAKKEEEINRKNREGNKHGVWKGFYEEGIVVKWEGRYINGKKNGYFREYSPKGKLLTTTKWELGEVISNTEEHQVVEEKIEYYDNAKIKSIGNYNSKGNPVGIFRKYTPEGNISESMIYVDGFLMGVGGVVDEAGVKHGDWIEYYESGELRCKGQYKEGKRVEKWIYYHPNGKIEQKGQYRNDGRTTGEWTWYYNYQ